MLSRIAEKFDTTIDWILTGNLNIEKAIILERIKESQIFQDFADKMEKIVARMLALKFVAAKENATKEEQEKISEILKDNEDFLVLAKKMIKEGMEEVEQVRHFEQISHKSPLYSIFRQIEKMFNKGERAKIGVIEALLVAFESNKDDVMSKINVLKAFIAAFEKDIDL